MSDSALMTAEQAALFRDFDVVRALQVFEPAVERVIHVVQSTEGRDLHGPHCAGARSNSKTTGGGSPQNGKSPGCRSTRGNPGLEAREETTCKGMGFRRRQLPAPCSRPASRPPGGRRASRIPGSRGISCSPAR